MDGLSQISLDIPHLLTGYRSGGLLPQQVIREVYRRIEDANRQLTCTQAIWIYLAPLEETLARLEAITGQVNLPLYGIPFAIKDNIDWSGVPTTAGCPCFSYIPAHSAPVVERLLQAGAVLIGKTNMDQFATGLVGVRSPYGVCPNPFNADYISGGSSTGSAAAVSRGLVSFALGTDTAGSGRVPAAFTNIIGLKPTRGILSTRGVVPAVRSLDCVSIFALSGLDAQLVLSTTTEFDPSDIYSQTISQLPLPDAADLRIGVPDSEYLDFQGNSDASSRYDDALNILKKLGCSLQFVNFQPFQAAAQLLYGGAWLAERTLAVGDFLREQPESAIDPTVRKIILSGHKFSAIDAYRDRDQLRVYQRQAEEIWQAIDVLVLPTTPTIYRIDEVLANPLELNTNLGKYTNFVNLMDLSAIAVPNGFQANGLPVGLSFIAPAGYDEALCGLGATFCSVSGQSPGVGIL